MGSECSTFDKFRESEGFFRRSTAVRTIENANVSNPITKTFDKDVSNDESLDQKMTDGKISTAMSVIDQTVFLRSKNRKFTGMMRKDEFSWQGSYDFICIGDPQLGMGDQKKEEEFCRLAVKFINQRSSRVKFVVVCGDHVHNLEGMWSKGDLQGGRKKRIQELKAYKSIWSKLDKDIPLVCVCGNHDVGNAPTKRTIQLYKEEFGDDYLTFWCGGVKFFVLNSQIIQGLKSTNELAKAHERWFEKEVASGGIRDQPIHTIAMCHIPPFCWDVEEKECNFNWPIEKRKKWLDKMAKANIKKIYCAHYHRRSGGKYKGIEVVVSAAVGTCIRTKPLPKEIQKSHLDGINFRLGFEGFGGTVAEERTSGLQIVTVSKERLTERWLNIREIRRELNQSFRDRAPQLRTRNFSKGCTWFNKGYGQYYMR